MEEVMSQLFDLTGKVALVTGGSRGIGRGICLRLAEAGAKVVVNAHSIESRDENAAAVVAAIEAKGGDAIAVAADVSVKTEVEAMIAKTVASFGSLDILVNNAGICPFHEFLTMPE